MTRWAFGLDLSGYATGKSCLAAAAITGDQVTVTILSSSVFSQKVKTGERIEKITSNEVKLLNEVIRVGPIAVDIPIDLQQLSSGEPVEWIWELTLRPIDKALRALAPRASLLGAPVARFANLMGQSPFQQQLGLRLFETYPRAVLQLLDYPYKNLKGNQNTIVVEETAKKIGIHDISPALSGDELDAIICAIVAAAPVEHRLEGAALADRIQALETDKHGPTEWVPPRGYRLLMGPMPFTSVTVRRFMGDATDWVRQRP